MERGSYSKLDQINQIEIELNEHVPAVSLVKPSEQSNFDGAQKKRIDYVLVHEITKDAKEFKELDEEEAKAIRKFERWRYSFERYLENKLGLILQRKIVDIEDVGVRVILVWFIFVKQLQIQFGLCSAN